jgi:LacI family transcriptional regulator
LENHRIERELLDAGLPTIALDMSEDQLLAENPLSRFTDLRVDSKKAAELAAEHLLERRFPAYAFVGINGRIWSDRRAKGFEASIRKAGFEPAMYEPPTDERLAHWEQERPLLAEWIARLPKPLGVMACNDVRGRQVLDACRLVGVEVPKDVAVVGVDNDELFCELANPTLSSVALNAVEAGYAAAAQLDAMMRGEVTEPSVLMVQALRVITRQSSDSTAIEDRSVADALSFIKQSKGRGISVPDVAKYAQLPRRELDTRFRQTVGHTVLNEIQRVRLNHAKRLLEETDFAIPQVAEASGYSSASYMVQVFRQRLKTTPTKYRASVRKLSARGGPNGALRAV